MAHRTIPFRIVNVKLVTAYHPGGEQLAVDV